MTTIKNGNTLQEVALFTAANRNRSFVNMMTGEAPKQAKGDKKGKIQTSPFAPIVRITDLSKTAGDNVDMQIIHKLNKRPTMGDKKLAGRGENLSFADFELKILQGRHMVDSGGRMSQQRTKHDLIGSARTMLGPYFNDLQDQVATVHMAGARGDFLADDTIVPLEGHSEYDEILVNDVTPPTYDRHFFGGDATSVGNLDDTDIFTLSAVDNLRLFIEEMANPIHPIQFEGDKAAKDDPFYVLNVTPRQWYDFEQSASYKDWQQLAAAAINRSRHLDHPVFKGEMVMHGNILIKKYKGMPIRFNPGSSVRVSNNDDDASTSIQTAQTTIDRAMLLGGQALANAYGKSQTGSHYFAINQEKVDHKNGTETSIAWMNGLKKIRFKNKNGRTNDHGVMVMDTAVKGQG